MSSIFIKITDPSYKGMDTLDKSSELDEKIFDIVMKYGLHPMAIQHQPTLFADFIELKEECLKKCTADEVMKALEIDKYEITTSEYSQIRSIMNILNKLQ